MHCPTRLASSTAIAWAALASPVSMGQTPVPAPQPSLTLPWLAGFSCEPGNALSGTTFRCTVTLLRPAVNPMVISVAGTTRTEIGQGGIGTNSMYSFAPREIPATLIVPAGSTRAGFEVRTSCVSNPMVPREVTTYGIEVTYGKEKLWAGFRVSSARCPT